MDNVITYRGGNTSSNDPRVVRVEITTSGAQRITCKTAANARQLARVFGIYEQAVGVEGRTLVVQP